MAMQVLHVPSGADNVFSVVSGISSDHYTITIDTSARLAHTCTCPAFQRAPGSNCKHIALVNQRIAYRAPFSVHTNTGLILIRQPGTLVYLPRNQAPGSMSVAHALQMPGLSHCSPYVTVQQDSPEPIEEEFISAWKANNLDCPVRLDHDRATGEWILRAKPNRNNGTRADVIAIMPASYSEEDAVGSVESRGWKVEMNYHTESPAWHFETRYMSVYAYA